MLFARRFSQAAVSGALLVLLFSCSKPGPIQIGFIGGLSGKAADLGVAGRNGVMLAIEKRNAAGGIGGRKVELLSRDDEQKPDAAAKALSDLLDADCEAIIGPMTSSVAMKIVDRVNSSKSILLSPTVTTKTLTGIDDNFMRVISDTAPYASKTASYVARLGLRRGVALYDEGNKSYTLSWFEDFRRTIEAGGGDIVKTASFVSSPDSAFGGLVEELLREKPDFFLIITNSIDSASICQQIRKQGSKVQVVMSEWASTERFTELAGEAAEGVLVSQFMDRRDESARFQSFLKDYRERFGQEPGFAGVAGYDAAHVVLEALTRSKDGESLKASILRRKSFECLQGTITIDSNGDADRKTFLTQIRGSRYVTLN